jgi:hypothetical protein
MGLYVYSISRQRQIPHYRSHALIIISTDGKAPPNIIFKLVRSSGGTILAAGESRWLRSTLAGIESRRINTLTVGSRPKVQSGQYFAPPV